MNRVVITLLSVLIALVAVNAVLVWRADQRAHEDAEKQACIAAVEAKTIVGIVGPGFAVAAEDRDAQAQLQNLGILSNELDAC